MRNFVCSLLLCGLGLFCWPAQADVIDWIGGASGDFSDGTQWDGGVVPGVDDVANFDTEGEVTVTMIQSETIENLTFNGTAASGPPIVAPRLTINLETFQLSTKLETGNPFILENDTGGPARTFALVGNGVFNANHRFIVDQLQLGPSGTAPDGVNLILQDAAVLRANRNVGHVIAAGTSTVSVEVLSGSRLDINAQTVIGSGADATATILVAGAGSEFLNSNSGSIRYHNFGVNGTATMTVQLGGSYQSNAYSGLGMGTTGDGRIYVTGTNSTLDIARGLYVGGGTTNDSNPPAAGGYGLFSLADNATASVGLLHVLAADPSAGRIGEVILDGSVTMTATNSIFEAGSLLHFGLQDTAQPANLLVTETMTLNDSFLDLFLPTGLEPELGDSFALVQYGTLTGSFANPNNWVTANGYLFQIDYALDGQNIIGVTVIPEPAAAVMIGAGLLLLLLRRQRSDATGHGLRRAA